MKNQQNPFARYLADLPTWDKTPRLETLFTGYLGAANTLFNKKAAELLGIAAVARAECPGIAWNHVPVLVGKQGVGKSVFLKALFGDHNWTNLCTMEYGDDNAQSTIYGFTCIEIENSTSHAENPETLRNFISRNKDIWQETTHHRQSTELRECVFVGTSNVPHFLIDPTGNRRYWDVDVKINEVDIDALEAERDQIWAEAKHLWQLAAIAAGDKCSIDLDAMAVNLPARTEG